ncbi:hypothetical protein HanIR_Chr02g0087001 [Helianthus annuus]|nr:hypothetical protein HanIR_Chr02g0087001 [Helianthus annuus]
MAGDRTVVVHLWFGVFGSRDTSVMVLRVSKLNVWIGVVWSIGTWVSDFSESNNEFSNFYFFYLFDSNSI